MREIIAEIYTFRFVFSNIIMSKKAKTAFFCQSCGFETAKWQGRCPSCGEWNTIVEEPKPEKGGHVQHLWRRDAGTGRVERPAPVLIHEVSYESSDRVTTTDSELNRVLGGGIMPGSVVLIGGEPGIGKSTLMLQIALSLAHLKVLYVSGEESAQQIKMRADRLAAHSDNCYLLTETDLSVIFTHIDQLKPDLLVLDSIQTLATAKVESAAGSVSQVRECTAELIRFAKETGTPVFMIGHITKEGSLAGPKVLEHMVDTVLQFEGDRHLTYRILRTTKNRFGSTSELGIYEMQAEGLRQVSNPSEVLISQREGAVSGITIGATLEGNRPLLIEVQSLVTPSVYGNPQRTCTGFDTRRLGMLLAVLEKRGGYRVNFSDVFLNITGGLKVEDPAVDLAVCVSVLSSFQDIPIPDQCCFAAEIGLGGEIRAISRMENRIAEAARLGFNRIFASKFSLKGIKTSAYDIKVEAVSRLEEVIDLLGL